MVTTNPSQESPENSNGKRAAGSDLHPAVKRGKTAKTEKEQKTIEETMEGIETVADDDDVKEEIGDNEDKSIGDSTKNSGASEKANGRTNGKEVVEKDDTQPEESEPAKDKSDNIAPQEDTKEKASNNSNDKAAKSASNSELSTTEDNNDAEPDKEEKNAFDEVKADVGEVTKTAQEEESQLDKKIANNKDSVAEDPEREEAMPSSILEKGIIYFFFRGRVGVEDPQGVDDIARSYIVLRPLPLGAKLSDGPLEDSGNARLLALPKKVLPKSRNDRFLMFVDKTNVTIKELKEQFISSSEYSTKTAGTSHSPAATPIAEGIYAITTTGRDSHLAYHITVPELGEIQKDLGLNEKGSFVLSVKNPTASGPANATLDNPADYPEALMKQFRGLRWTPLTPEFLDYTATQFLIIGEGLGDTEKATKELDKDKKDDVKAAPSEELDKLEDENSKRIEFLKGDDAVLADLGLSSKEYPKMQTTW